jgi:hypothetical protein
LLDPLELGKRGLYRLVGMRAGRFGELVYRGRLLVPLLVRLGLGLKGRSLLLMCTLVADKKENGKDK